MSEPMPTSNPDKKSFVHLRVHSDFSMCDGLNKIPKILAKVADMGMPAVAITDQVNMCGLVKYYNQAHGNGVKPLIGSDFWLRNPLLGEDIFRTTLIAKNNDGYKNITLLISRAYQRGAINGRAVVDAHWLAEHAEGFLNSLITAAISEM